MGFGRVQDAGAPPLAPQLQEEILTVAGQMLPQCVLDLLSLPLDEKHRSERQEGVEVGSHDPSPMIGKLT